MNYCVWIGGASASGKSKAVEGVRQRIEAYYYRPSQAFFDMAIANGIAQLDAFTRISGHNAEQYYVDICSTNSIVVADVHYAIQPKRDNNLALGILTTDVKEDYVPTITDNFLLLLKENRVKILAVLLYADAVVLFDRADKRQNINGQLLRAVSISDIEIESKFEKRFWHKVVCNYNVDSRSIDTTNKSIDETVSIVTAAITQNLLKEMNCRND
jgi:cytidylate kinase